MKYLLRLVVVILILGSAYAQSNLPACPSSSGYFHNCFGTFTLSSGGKYVGEWQDDKFNGQGTLYNSIGSIISQGIWAGVTFAPSALVQQVTTSNGEKHGKFAKQSPNRTN